MKKIFELREYLMDYLLKQYGLMNIAKKNFDIILEVLFICIISFRDSIGTALRVENTACNFLIVWE